MKSTEQKLRSLIRKQLMQEIFGFGKKKVEVYRQALIDGGLTDRNIEIAMPNMPEYLAAKGEDPSAVTAAVRELLQSPRDHIGGIPSGKAIYKVLRRMGAINESPMQRKESYQLSKNEQDRLRAEYEIDMGNKERYVRVSTPDMTDAMYGRGRGRGKSASTILDKKENTLLSWTFWSGNGGSLGT